MAFLKEVVGNRYVFDCNRADDVILFRDRDPRKPDFFYYQGNVELILLKNQNISISASGASLVDIQTAVHLLRLLVDDGVV